MFLRESRPEAQGKIYKGKSEYGIRSTIDIRRHARREPPQKFPDDPSRWALELAVGSCKGVGTGMDVVAAVTRTFLVCVLASVARGGRRLAN